MSDAKKADKKQGTDSPSPSNPKASVPDMLRTLYDISPRFDGFNTASARSILSAASTVGRDRSKDLEAWTVIARSALAGLMREIATRHPELAGDPDAIAARALDQLERSVKTLARYAGG